MKEYYKYILAALAGAGLGSLVTGYLVKRYCDAVYDEKIQGLTDAARENFDKQLADKGYLCQAIVEIVEDEDLKEQILDRYDRIRLADRGQKLSETKAAEYLTKYQNALDELGYSGQGGFVDASSEIENTEDYLNARIKQQVKEAAERLAQEYPLKAPERLSKPSLEDLTRDMAERQSPSEDDPVATDEAYGYQEEDIPEFNDGSEIYEHIHDVIDSSRPPYVISEDEFADPDIGFETETITYYSGDDTLCDSKDCILQIADHIGEEALEKFEGDIVYVRNPRLGMDYEVVWSPQSYSADVLGYEPEAKNRPRGFRRNMEEDW